VEGDAERFLLPALAKLHDTAMDLDALGISVCSIAGTNFGPYVQLPGPQGLDIPFVVLTDFDPKGEPGIQEDADPEADFGKSYGKNRVVNQIMVRLVDEKEWEKLSFGDVMKKANDFGIFLNEYTFEVDLFREGTANEFAQAMKELTDNKEMHKRFDELSKHPETLEPKQFLRDINSIGKGRLAQRLASLFLAVGADVCPPYIKAALDYMKAKLA
jgi:putative ATP-dependent endonuclease of OLD family